jgi:hypothetical protein
MEQNEKNNIFFGDEFFDKQQLKKKNQNKISMFKHTSDIFKKLNSDENLLADFFDIFENIFKKEFNFIKKRLFSVLKEFDNLEHHLKNNLTIFKENFKIFTNILIDDFYSLFKNKINIINFKNKENALNLQKENKIKKIKIQPSSSRNIKSTLSKKKKINYDNLLEQKNFTFQNYLNKSFHKKKENENLFIKLREVGCYNIRNSKKTSNGRFKSGQYPDFLQINLNGMKENLNPIKDLKRSSIFKKFKLKS